VGPQCSTWVGVRLLGGDGLTSRLASSSSFWRSSKSPLKRFMPHTMNHTNDTPISGMPYDANPLHAASVASVCPNPGTKARYQTQLAHHEQTVRYWTLL